MAPPPVEAYQVGVVCTLPKEMTAAAAGGERARRRAEEGGERARGQVDGPTETAAEGC